MALALPKQSWFPLRIPNDEVGCSNIRNSHVEQKQLSATASSDTSFDDFATISGEISCFDYYASRYEAAVYNKVRRSGQALDNRCKRNRYRYAPYCAALARSVLPCLPCHRSENSSRNPWQLSGCYTEDVRFCLIVIVVKLNPLRIVGRGRYLPSLTLRAKDSLLCRVWGIHPVVDG